jgi:hypothetical protein
MLQFGSNGTAISISTAPNLGAVEQNKRRRGMENNPQQSLLHQNSSHCLIWIKQKAVKTASRQPLDNQALTSVGDILKVCFHTLPLFVDCH